MKTTRNYPLEQGCEDCGRAPTRFISFWVNGMRYRVCKEHAQEYRSRCNTFGSIDPRTGEVKARTWQPQTKVRTFFA